MIKAEFTLMVIQDDILDETLEVVQEFKCLTELFEAICSFTAMQSKAALKTSEVRAMFSGKRAKISLPPTKQGYGPNTVVVISKIAFSVV